MNNTNQQMSEIMVSYKPIKYINSQINSSLDAIKTIRKLWNNDTIEMHEEVKILFVNSSNTVIGFYNMSKGGITGSLVDIRIILAIALKSLATGLILIHNHPSGNLTPSNSDLAMVKKLNTACKLIDVALLDSIIITKDSYMSFNDGGLI